MIINNLELFEMLVKLRMTRLKLKLTMDSYFHVQMFLNRFADRLTPKTFSSHFFEKNKNKKI